MGHFGQTLFGGSRFIRWALSPFVLLFGVLMPLAIEQWTPMRVVLMFVGEAMCAALLVGFWLPGRIGRRAFRVLTGLVFLAYAGYLIDEFLFRAAGFRLTGSEAETSPRNAVGGFVVIGLPCLWYSLFGRFTLKPPPENPPETEKSDEMPADDGA
jgi:hypothetical protein